MGPRLAELGFALEELQARKTIARIWQKDASVWSDKLEHHQIIANSLGWLTVPGQVLERVAELKSFAQEIRAAGFTHAVVHSLEQSACRRLCGDHAILC